MHKEIRCKKIHTGGLQLCGPPVNLYIAQIFGYFKSYTKPFFVQSAKFERLHICNRIVNFNTQYSLDLYILAVLKYFYCDDLTENYLIKINYE